MVPPRAPVVPALTLTKILGLTLFLALCLWIGWNAASVAQIPPAGKTEDQTQAQMMLQKAEIDAARKLIEGGRLQAAIETLQNLLEKAPQSPFVPEAYLLLGQSLGRMQKWDEANGYFKRLLDEYPTHELAAETRFGLATGLLQKGQVETAISLLREAKVQTTSSALKLAILRRLEDAYLLKVDYAHAIESALEARALVPDDETRQIDDRIRVLVLTKAGEPELARIAERFPSGFPGDLAMLRLIDVYASRDDDHKVTRTAREFFKRFPNHEQTGAATAALAQQRKKAKSKDLLIGALLPLSGALSPYGNQVLNGMKIALDQSLETAPRMAIGLVTKDTENDPKQLMVELDDLLEDYRPVAVVGPLLTRHLKDVAPIADSHDIVFFTPSATLPDVQRLGRSLFNAAVNNRALVRDLAERAIDTLGWKRLCILAPNDPYGSEMAQLFAEEVRRLGGEVIAGDIYEQNDTDFGSPIKRIKAADLKKYGKLEPMMKKGKPAKNYVPGFDAIFLPGNVEKVGLLAGQLHFHGMNVPILGTNDLNSPELIRIGGRAVERTTFEDSFFADSPNPLVRNFVSRYRTRFHDVPTAFAAQAYEATQLILDAILKGATTGRAVRESLKKIKNAPGLFGPLTMSPSGYLERRYVLIQVKGGKFIEMSNER
jgi:branched-chain amino acid transport system substrate-binding protein